MARSDAYANVFSNIATRRFGGTTFGWADPYVSGYHFIWFENLPKQLPSYVLNEDLTDVTKVQNLLAASCMRVTPPGGTLNRIEFNALGGTKWGVPGNIDYGNQVTIQFLEFSDVPILEILNGWFTLMRDAVTGIADIDDSLPSYTKSAYSATLLYFTSTPDLKGIEYYAYYDGVFPLKDPQDLFTGDITASDKLEIELDFNVDYVWHASWVYDKAEARLAAFRDSAIGVRNAGENYA